MEPFLLLFFKKKKKKWWIYRSLEFRYCQLDTWMLLLTIVTIVKNGVKFDTARPKKLVDVDRLARNRNYIT